MSSRRLQDDYRRILGITEDVRGLDPALPRMRIAGARGIYQQGDGSTKSGNAPDDGTDPITPDETDTNKNEDGSGQGDQNTGGGLGGGGSIDDGSDFIIDPEDQPAPLDPFDNTFGDGWGSGAGSIKFEDCETGACIEIVERGGYIPPEGWDNPDIGPVPSDFIQGRYWRSVAGGGNIIGPTRETACANSSVYPYFCEDGRSTDERCQTSPNCNAISASLGIVSWACPANPSNPDVAAACALTNDDMRPTIWPADGCIQLAPNDNGNWQASTRENPLDMTAKYTQEFSRLELCNSSGETIWIDKNNRGGYTYLNVDQGVWRSTDASGKPRAFGSSSTHKFELR